MLALRRAPRLLGFVSAGIPAAGSDHNDLPARQRRENLAQANKLSRTFATLLEALNRHRGKGQQKVTVEHVHVHSGGQAVVAVVEPTGGGGRAKLENQSHPGQIGYAPQSEMWCALPDERAAMPTGSDGEWPVPDARWNKPRCSEG
jgi:hypothetical protein